MTFLQDLRLSHEIPHNALYRVEETKNSFNLILLSVKDVLVFKLSYEKSLHTFSSHRFHQSDGLISTKGCRYFSVL